MAAYDLTELCDIFFDTYRIPLCLFDEAGTLQKQFFGPGRRQTALYLSNSAAVLQMERQITVPLLLLDEKGACWCRIPLGTDTLLLGPVQTGSSPFFPYENIPEHSWGGMRGISRCLVSLLLGKDKPLAERGSVYPDSRAAAQNSRLEHGDLELDPHDEIFDCVQNGDLAQLDELLLSGTFLPYLDQVIPDTSVAITVFHFNLAKTYHSALAAGVPINDAAPLVETYIKDMQKYRSVAAYKAGIQRMIYDFARISSQYADKRYSPLVNRAMMYIKNHLYSPVSASTIAEHCGSSVSTLQHRFKEETGKSLSDSIRENKIERSCYFLRHTDLSCSDIAFKMGYGSQSFFITQFKKEKGMTPLAWRRLG